MFKSKFLLILSSIFVIIILSLSPIAITEEIEDFDLKTELNYDLLLNHDEDLALEAGGYFVIPTHRGDIKEASLNITCSPDIYGNYLKNPKLDIGLDGDYEWVYSGMGYGSIGKQTEFINGMTKRRVITANRGGNIYDNRSVIYLPTTCDVKNATMKIKSGPGRYKEDLVVGITYRDGDVYYMKSNDGKFNEGVKFFNDVMPWSWYIYGIGLGDFDNDNDLDLITGYKSSSTATNIEIYLYENMGGTGDPPWNSFPVGNKPIGYLPSSGWDYLMGMAVEDFDNDDNLDFVASGRSSFYLFKGYGNLSFEMSLITSSFGGSWTYGKDAADFNNDGNMDLISGCSSANIYYFEGKGDGTFKTEIPIPSGTTWGYQYLTVGADFNDDFNADIITKYYSSSTNLIRGYGDGTFKDPINTGLSPVGYAPGDNYDFNYDGYQDLVVWERTTSWPYSYYYYAYYGNGDGTFWGPRYIGDGEDYTYGVAAPPRMPLGGCDNLSINIGDDGGTPEVKFNGVFTDEKEISFKSHLNNLITKPNNGLKVMTDSYGNRFYEIPIRFESDTTGSILIHDLDIKYDYTAQVELLPGERYNLTTDLDDLIPADLDDSREIRIYFGMYSDTPGKVRLSDLHIEYNGGPKCTGIGDITVDEAAQSKAINLTKYFTDDYDSGVEMSYGIQSNGDPDHIQLSVQNQWLYVDSTAEPDWFGSTEAKVWCKDTEGVMTISNQFKLTVKEVDDPPMVYNPIPNIELRENQTKTPIDLDDPIKDYFIDVDSTELYYRAALATPEEHSSQLQVSVVQTTNKLRVQSIGTFGRGIGVRIYCDDDISLLSMSVSELESLIDTYQAIVVNITSGTSTFPPQWLDIPLSPIDEDTPQIEILNLYDYVTDADDHLSNLTFSIYSLSYSGYIDLIIDDESGDLSIYPRDNFDGISKATLMVTDDEHNSDLTTLNIEIIPENDQPIVEISEPTNGSAIRGLVDIIGSAYDPEGDLSKVEIAIGETGSWLPVDGLGYWTYKLDVNTITQSSNILLVKVRAEDATGSQSLYDKVYLKIKRPKDDRDGDGYPDVSDKFPDNPSEWKDSDGDKYGDNSDAFSDDMTQWSDTDGDGYGDNSEGNNHDRFPFDNTQWLDTDGDGHGDNDWGNDGDFYKYDPERWKKDEKAAEEEEDKTELLPQVLFYSLILVVVITALILINYSYKYFNYRKKK